MCRKAKGIRQTGSTCLWPQRRMGALESWAGPPARGASRPRRGRLAPRGGRSDQNVAGRLAAARLANGADQRLDRLGRALRAGLGEPLVERRLAPPAVVEFDP